MKELINIKQSVVVQYELNSDNSETFLADPRNIEIVDIEKSEFKVTSTETSITIEFRKDVKFPALTSFVMEINGDKCYYYIRGDGTIGKICPHKF